MSLPFIPKIGQSVRVKPQEGSITAPVQHLIGKVVELERDSYFFHYHNGKNSVAAERPTPYEARGALVVFGNLPERYRIPLPELVPV